MWRFLFLLGLVGSAQAADEKTEPVAEKQEAPNPQPSAPVKVWDSVSGAWMSLSEAVKLAKGRLVLEQVPTVRDQVLRVDGIKVIEQRERLLLHQRLMQAQQVENELLERYRGL